MIIALIAGFVCVAIAIAVIAFELGRTAGIRQCKGA